MVFSFCFLLERALRSILLKSKGNCRFHIMQNQYQKLCSLYPKCNSSIPLLMSPLHPDISEWQWFMWSEGYTSSSPVGGNIKNWATKPLNFPKWPEINMPPIGASSSLFLLNVFKLNELFPHIYRHIHSLQYSLVKWEGHEVIGF